MVQLILSVVIGAVIGAVTNELAIRMLFRPYNAWKIGKWKVPFTPGLIPKRREELAVQLGQMVENYLFTAKGLKEFIENANLKEKVYQDLIGKIEGYQGDKTIGEIVQSVFQVNITEKASFMIQEKIFALTEQVKGKALDEIVPNEILTKIDGSIDELSRHFILEIKEYLHSEQGMIWLESVIVQLLEGKKMLGFLAGMLFDGKQIQQKLITYLDQLLEQPDSAQIFAVFLKKEWDQWKGKAIGEWINPIEPYLKEQVWDWTRYGIKKVETISLKQLFQKVHQTNLLRSLYDQFFVFLQERLENWFSYLSISKVVKEQVNQFSLPKLEAMIVDVSGKELKMITYFGGILGGVIGLVQGLIFYFY